MAREQRKLAAILAADVVGYSRLMGRDESGTLAQVTKRFTDYQKDALNDIVDLSAMEAATIGLSASILATVAATTYTSLITILICEAGTFAIFGAVSNMLARDPQDLNFGAIATSDYPRPLTVKPDSKNGISRTIASALNGVVNNHSRALGNLLALSTSINRAQGAHAAGDARAEARQMSAARTFGRRAAGPLEKGAELRAHAADLIDDQDLKLSATATEVSNAKSAIAEKGFPKIVEKTIAKYLTRKEDRVNALIILSGAMHKVSNRKMDFMRVLRGTKVASAELRTARALRNFAS